MNNSFNYSGFSDLVKSSGKKLEAPGYSYVQDRAEEIHAGQKNYSAEVRVSEYVFDG